MDDSKVRSLVDYRLRTPRNPAPPAGNSSPPPITPKPKLLDQVRQAIRTRHYSPRTEESYVGWIKRFVFYHNKRHPAEMGEAEIARFLSSLASESHVSASTQNQALNAVLFLYREVLRKEVGYVNGVVRAKRPKKLPVVLTRQEVRSIVSFLGGAEWLESPSRQSPTLFATPLPPTSWRTGMTSVRCRNCSGTPTSAPR